MTVPRKWAAVLTGLVVALTAWPAPAGAQGEAEPPRLLIFAVPGLTWAESTDVELPALDSFFADAAMATLAPRSVLHNARAGDAYLTISAGTRTTTEVGVDGQLLALEERFAGSPAAEVFQRRTGDSAHGSYVSLSWPLLVRENDNEPYDAVPGLLADTLGDNEVTVAVVANASGSDTTVASWERQAGLAFVNSDGTLGAGSLGDEILLPDAPRPFGVRLDPDRVVEGFQRAWHAPGAKGGVVLVEASDLARSLRYRPLVSRARYEEVRAQGLAEADALFARLIDDVDPERDTVMVIAPYAPPGRANLTVVGLRAPGAARGGYLKSASTQRSGVVSLVDVAPTILETFAIDRPTDMEGRAFERSSSGASFDSRRDRLVAIGAASRFRERLLFPTTLVLVLVLAGVTAMAAMVIAGEWGRRARRAVAFAALANLAGLPASYLARAFPLEDLGSAFYWSFVVVVALVVAVAATAIGRRWGDATTALSAVLALDLVVLVGDVMTGSNLHLSAAFGYSPTGNSRLYGISNYSFGQVAAGSCLLSAVVAARWPTKRGRLAAVGLLGFVLVVLGVPVWGSDVGGILAFTPTIIVFASLLYRYRFRLRGLIVTGLITLVAVTAFGFIDLARPPEQRAHLGRLFERIGNEGLEPLLNIVDRKLVANLRVSTSSFWVAAIPIGILFWVFLARWSSRPLEQVKARIPTLPAALAAAVVAAVLGSILNDSGAIVGGVTLLVVTASLAYLSVQPEPA